MDRDEDDEEFVHITAQGDIPIPAEMQTLTGCPAGIKGDLFGWLAPDTLDDINGNGFRATAFTEFMLAGRLYTWDNYGRAYHPWRTATSDRSRQLATNCEEDVTGMP